MKANRYPCPKADCPGIFREAPSVGHGSAWACDTCGEAWPK